LMKKRAIVDVDIDESLIQSGDFFGIVRLDGLDPLLAWAMGSTTGHTTIAVRDENNTLFIAESNAKGAYWPKNGIQINPFSEWMEYARKANYNLVHAPLSPEYAAKFDSAKALKFFKTVEGIDYGYHNLLFAWIDTLEDNYPCLPPDFQSCLVWDHLELFFSYVDKLVPSIGDQLFNQALNFRVGTSGLKPADVFQRAAELGIKNGELPAIVEQDSWKYNIPRDGVPSEGESMVCCTFVCRMWEEAGIFAEIDADINCHEFTNWDVYSLDVFDVSKTSANRPKQCVAADPDNELCQLTGQYTLRLNNFNSKSMYPHMAEKCASKVPEYAKDPKC